MEEQQIVENNEEYINLLNTIQNLTAQEVINYCNLDENYKTLCTKYEKEIWTFLLQAHFPTWGLNDNPKEYYIRIAKINGIQLLDSSKYAGVSGQQLLDQQGRKPYFSIKVGDLDAFPIPDLLAKAYSGGFETVINQNLQFQIIDPERWIFQIPLDSFVDPTCQEIIKDYLITIFIDNTLAKTPENCELDVISVSHLLQCKELLCDSLIETVESRMTKLEQAIKENNDVFQEEVAYLTIEFNVAPGFVASYLRAMSDLLYRTDNFNEEIITYYREIMKLIPNIAVSLMPHGYPFTKRQNIDRFDPRLFYIDPLLKRTVTPDFLSAKVCAVLDPTDPNSEDETKKLRVWRSGSPPPLIQTVPSMQIIQERMERSLPGIVGFILNMIEIMKKEFPEGQAGFVLAGGLPSICLNDWMCEDNSHWLQKTDSDFFIYGDNLENRKKAFILFIDEVAKLYPPSAGNDDLYQYSHWQSVVSITKEIYFNKDLKEIPRAEAFQAGGINGGMRKGKYTATRGLQIINTNSLSGFEVIMNFDTSHIQVGWDCHNGWMATPFWELYYPRRETLLVRYNIRSPRFAKVVFRGFSLKMIMPYSLILTPKGINYSYVLKNDKLIQVLPKDNRTYADDLELYGTVRADHLEDPSRQRETLPGFGGVVHGPRHQRSNPQESRRFIKIRVGNDEIKEICIGSKDLKSIQEEYPVPSWGANSIATIKQRVKFSGQFKNGFDAYVREKYLTYELNHMDLTGVEEVKVQVDYGRGPQEYMDYKRVNIDPDKNETKQIIKKARGLSHTRFVMRDCKFLIDPMEEPVEYKGKYGSGTLQFNFSMRASILEQNNIDLNPRHGIKYSMYDPSSEAEKTTAIRDKLSARDNVGKGRLVTKAVGRIATRLPDSDDLTSAPMLNTSLIRKGYTVPMMVEGIIQLKVAKEKENSGAVDEKQKEYSVFKINTYGNSTYYGGDYQHTFMGNIDELPEVSANDLHHDSDGKLYEKLKAEYIKVRHYRDTDFNIDAVDLHERFYTDEEREQLPIYDFDQWQEIRLGKIKIPEEVTAIRVRTPVIIQETLFLDESDWTMQPEEVIANRDKWMFNCLCYQDFTGIKEDTIYNGSISIFRSFLIYE